MRVCLLHVLSCDQCSKRAWYKWEQSPLWSFLIVSSVLAQLCWINKSYTDQYCEIWKSAGKRAAFPLLWGDSIWCRRCFVGSRAAAPLAVLKSQPDFSLTLHRGVRHVETPLPEAGVRAARWRPASIKASARRQRVHAGLADGAS